MANIKNFGLIGVGSDVQFSKAGPRLINNAGTFNFKSVNGTTDAGITASTVVASSNVTTSGNLLLNTDAGVVQFGLAGDTTISRLSAGVVQFNGTAAIVVPTGTTAQEPTATAGGFRFNSESGYMEFANGTTWISLATGTSSVSSFSAGSTGFTPATASTGAVTLDGILNPAHGGTGVNNGSNTITLGGSVVTAGSFTTTGANPITLATTGPTNLVLPTSGTLLTTTDTTKYVASFQTDLAGLTPTTASTGAVTLSGTLGVASGGTGVTTLASNGVVIGAGTGPVTTATGTQYQVLQAGAGGVPTFGLVDLTTSVTGVLPPANGGTGVNNGSNTITAGGNVNFGSSFTTTPANAVTFTTTGATNVTLPTSGTLVTTGTAVTSFSGGTTGLTPNSPTVGDVVLSGVLLGANGGTGVANTGKTITLGGNFATAGAFPVTLTASASTSLALPASGTVLVDGDIGTTVEAWSASLDALAAKTSTGILVQTGTNTYSSVSIATSGTGLAVANGSGVAGNPTLSVTHNLAGIEGLNVTGPFGFVVQTADGAFIDRSITGTTGRIVITNPDGVASDANVDLAPITQGSTGTSFVKVNIDGYGRVVDNTAVTTGDLTALLGGSYLALNGTNSPTATINFAGQSLTGLPTPVNASDAANKAYVDNAVSGLTWKDAVAALSTSDITAGGAAPLVIDGYTVANGDRVLLTTGTVNAGIYVVTVSGGSYTLARATDMATGSNADNSAVFVNNGTVYKNTGWVETASPAVVGTNALVFAQFSGAGSYSAGSGLTLTGTTFAVAYGAGIHEEPTGDVGINLFDATAGGLILTTDGTTRSTGATAALSLLLPSGSGLTQDATGLYIPTAGVTNTMLVNSSIGLNADSGTGTVSLGGILQVEGTAAQGIVTSTTGSTIAITANDATTTSKGVSSFSNASFTVTAGVVTISAAGVSNAQLANSTTTFAGTTGSTAVALGNTLDVVGGSTPITVAATGGTLTINVADASTSSKGLASFDPTYFTVTSGNVTWNTTTPPALTVSSLTDTGLTANGIMYAGAGGLLSSTAAAASGQFLIGTGSTPALGTIQGTTDRTTVTLTGGNFVTDIASTYVGQTSITTLGTVTTGTWNGSTVTVPYGGTGLTSVTTGYIPFGAGTSPLATSAALSFDGTNTLTVGAATVQGVSGGDLILTAPAGNGSVQLNPTGTGTVVVGPASGNAEIASESGHTMTLVGDTGVTLTVNAANNNIVLSLPTGTGVATIGGAMTASSYASNVASVPNALPNVQYVTNAITTATTNGVFAVTVSVTNSTVAMVTLPVGATVLTVKVKVTTADSSAVVTVGDAGNNSRFMASSENDPSALGLYVAETDDTITGSADAVSVYVSAATTFVGKATIVYELN